MGGFVGGAGGGGGGGGITTQSVVTGSRALGSVYQNSGAKPIFVSVQINGGSGAMGCVGYADGSNPPVTIVCSTTNTFAANVQFWVLPTNFYKVTATAQTSYTWVEWN